ncbi:MAG: hypothetical protein R2874_01520 [Desulfobacterales bacterium]
MMWINWYIRFFKAEHKKIAKNWATLKKVIDNLHEVCGEPERPILPDDDCGSDDATSPAIKSSWPVSDRGCSAFLFEVTDAIKKFNGKKKFKQTLTTRKIRF